MLDLLRHPHLDVGGAAHHFLAGLADVFAAGVENAGARKVAGGKGRDRRGRCATRAFRRLKRLRGHESGGKNSDKTGLLQDG